MMQLLRSVSMPILAIASVAAPTHAAPSANAQATPEATLEHSITFLSEANSSPTPIDTSDDVVFLKVTVNGHDAWAMLDNACGHTVIDLTYAKSIGLTVGSIVGKLDLGAASLDERLVKGTSIVVPGQVTFNGSVVAIDMQPFSRLVGRPVQAIIGGDYLDRMAVLIQNSRKQMILAKSGDITPRVKVATLPLIDGNQVFAKINGQAVSLKVDMGYNGTIRLSDRAWARVVPTGTSAKEGKTASLDGVARTGRSVSNASLVLGQVSVNPISVSVGEKLPGTSDGLLGMTFLSKADFILDVDQKKLFLIPIEAPAVPSASAR
ncbi:aspartyl protease family protein [Sphingomonas yabuuchiae]|uniref:aspartyl protease family protein n=1 Tax=Sphingomonas yabuuchiae TaxID=172044 RepID=UPI003D983903